MDYFHNFACFTGRITYMEIAFPSGYMEVRFWLSKSFMIKYKMFVFRLALINPNPIRIAFLKQYYYGTLVQLAFSLVKKNRTLVLKQRNLFQFQSHFL